MPEPSKRPSLSTDLESRYNNQRVGSAFDVKQILNTKAGQIVDAISMQGANFQVLDGFEVKVTPEMTRFKDAQGNQSKELSIYMQGFSQKKYKG